jgi:hypothetical protein
MQNISDILTQAQIATGILVIAVIVVALAIKQHSRQSHK